MKMFLCFFRHPFCGFFRMRLRQLDGGCRCWSVATDAACSKTLKTQCKNHLVVGWTECNTNRRKFWIRSFCRHAWDSWFVWFLRRMFTFGKMSVRELAKALEECVCVIRSRRETLSSEQRRLDENHDGTSTEEKQNERNNNARRSSSGPDQPCKDQVCTKTYDQTPILSLLCISPDRK